jgi:hypothetical protein
MSESNTENQKVGSLREKYVIHGHDGVRHLIYHHEHPTNGEFIVFLDKQLDVDWETDDKFDQYIDATGTMKADLRKILHLVALLEPVAQNWPDDLKLSAKRMLGEAIVSVLEGDTDVAAKAVKSAKDFMMIKSKQVSRFWTLKACLFTGAVAAVLGTVVVVFRNQIIGFIGQTQFLLSLCFFAGCIGALLFVVLKLGKQPNADSTAERHLHYLEGVARIVGGGIAGVLIGGMVKLGLILPVFSQAGMETLAMCIAAMLAGASERLAAGIITKVENNEPLKQENSNADN